MCVARAAMVTLADDSIGTHDHRADGRIRRRAADTAGGELVGTLQVKLVEWRQRAMELLHGWGLFATATTIASSTTPPASRIASAQSRSVDPVVQTSSKSVTRRPATPAALHANRPCAARRCARDRPRCASPDR